MSFFSQSGVFQNLKFMCWDKWAFRSDHIKAWLVIKGGHAQNQNSAMYMFLTLWFYCNICSSLTTLIIHSVEMANWFCVCACVVLKMKLGSVHVSQVSILPLSYPSAQPHIHLALPCALHYTALYFTASSIIYPGKAFMKFLRMN